MPLERGDITPGHTRGQNAPVANVFTPSELYSPVFSTSSITDDRQKARNACNIGTQPVRPKVYGVNAPL